MMKKMIKEAPEFHAPHHSRDTREERHQNHPRDRSVGSDWFSREAALRSYDFAMVHFSEVGLWKGNKENKVGAGYCSDRLLYRT